MWVDVLSTVYTVHATQLYTICWEHIKVAQVSHSLQCNTFWPQKQHLHNKCSESTHVYPPTHPPTKCSHSPLVKESWSLPDTARHCQTEPHPPYTHHTTEWHCGIPLCGGGREGKRGPYTHLLALAMHVCTYVRTYMRAWSCCRTSQLRRKATREKDDQPCPNSRSNTKFNHVYICTTYVIGNIRT